MIAAIRRFLADEEGATAIEYAIIAALMAVALAAAMTSLTGGITTAFDNIKTTLTGTTSGGTPTP